MSPCLSKSAEFFERWNPKRTSFYVGSNQGKGGFGAIELSLFVDDVLTADHDRISSASGVASPADDTGAEAALKGNGVAGATPDARPITVDCVCRADNQAWSLTRTLVQAGSSYVKSVRPSRPARSHRLQAANNP
jgi:hypothetical protein